jgi:mono/diheme cytochrome c family protein
MRRMIAAVAAMLLATALLGQTPQKKKASSTTLARGKYLVEDVGMCGDCHSPHGENGEEIKEQRLQGTMLPFKPIVPMPVWAEKTPSIAGLPGWEKDAAIKFLMTGIAYNGLPGRPPMPRYRFNQQDAEAIVAYLKSLAPPQK